MTAKPKQTRAEIASTKDAAAIADLQAAGGIVAYGAWQTGAGNYKKARAVPDGAIVWVKSDTCASTYYRLDFTEVVRSPRAPAHICAWFAARPRAQRCVAII